MERTYDLLKKKDYMDYVKTLRIDPNDMVIGDVYAANINSMIQDAKDDMIMPHVGKVSDGYHSFDELYHHRMLLFAALVNTEPWRGYAWKSRQHHNPESDPMYDGMFICGVNTPYGPATYHCDNIYWDCFDCDELEYAPPYDGHTPDEAIYRILKTSKEFVRTGRIWCEIE